MAAAFSIAEFCEEHRISRGSYYNLDPQDRPDEMRVGGRVLISCEAAARWRRKMERRNKRAKPVDAAA